MKTRWDTTIMLILPGFYFIRHRIKRCRKIERVRCPQNFNLSDIEWNHVGKLRA